MRITTVHVLAGAAVLLGLRRGLDAIASVVAWCPDSRPSSVSPGDIVLVDLDLAPAILPGALETILRHDANVSLISGTKPVAPHWLEFINRSGVTVLALRDQSKGLNSVLAELHAAIEGPPGPDLAQHLIDAQPVLLQLGDLVRAVCTHPWRIRRPRDLAKLTSISLAQLRNLCVGAGFTRVEHFIVCIRALAYERLVVIHRMSRAAARLRVGFDDPSNMRRHFFRALERSPRVAIAIGGGLTA
jgi:hypothetical protein